MEGYNGWRNYETWNVALWIGNDEGLYALAREVDTYEDFLGSMLGGMDADEAVEVFGRVALETPDGVSWRDSGLDTSALDALMGDLE